MSFWSSSGVQGPFFKPTFSQHGDLPILVSVSAFVTKNSGTLKLTVLGGFGVQRTSQRKSRKKRQTKQVQGEGWESNRYI